jgi:hypothetical protein
MILKAWRACEEISLDARQFDVAAADMAVQ